MGWWSIGQDEITGDGPVGLTSEAFAQLTKMRVEASKPPLRWEDVTTLVCAAVARSSRELLARPDTKFTGLMARLEGEGVTEIKVTVDDLKAVAPEELTLVRDWAKKVSGTHREIADQTGRKRPSARELVAAAVHVLKASAATYLAEDETRKLTELVPVFEHSEGQIPADQTVAIIAAAIRRNERRLGLLVDGGALLTPEKILATTADGAQISASVEDAQAPRELVDEMCDRLEAIIREHRKEHPEAYLAKLSAQDREKYQRNADARHLPSLLELVEQIRMRLWIAPERWAPLKALTLETTGRSGIGLPTRPPPAKFVDSRLRVRHPKFGEGFVERTFEDGDKKYEVLFDGGKRVTLMAKFLEPVEP